MIEIERKFKVKGDFRPFATASWRMQQGYICRDKERTVRIRTLVETSSADALPRGFLTIKGISNSNGLSRYEFEKEISIEEANQLFALCLPGTIDKERFIVPHEGHTWEVDVFHGAQTGLVMAEIELQSETETFALPDWIGEEVTGNPMFYNSQLTTQYEQL